MAGTALVVGSSGIVGNAAATHLVEQGWQVHGLARLASPWHTDADLGRPIEVVTDMSKSRHLGFSAYQPTDDAFYDLFARLRANRLIP